LDNNNKEENDNLDEEKKEEVKRYYLRLNVYGGEFAVINGYTDIDKLFKLKIITNKVNTIESKGNNIKQNDEKGVYTLKGNEANFYLKGPFYEEYIIIEVYCNE
jgi:hypothetical protein